MKTVLGVVMNVFILLISPLWIIPMIVGMIVVNEEFRRRFFDGSPIL